MASPSSDFTIKSNITTTVTSNGPDYMFPYTLTVTTIKFNDDKMIIIYYGFNHFMYLLEHQGKSTS